VSSVKYELGIYIPENDFLHSDSPENPKSYTIYSLFIKVTILQHVLWSMK
jgi:hypothetical protein